MLPVRTRPGVSGLLLVVLALLSAAAPFAVDMYLPAFTELAADLDTSAASVQLTLTAFLVGLAAGQLLIGPLSDRFGRRTPLVVATAITVVVTVICALAPTIWLLIAMRFVQGLTASSGLVIGRAVGADRTEGAATARLFTLFSAIGGIAPVVAPLLGGVLVSAGWRAEFWALSGIFLLMFLGALFVVPESLPPERRHTDGIGGTLRTMRDIGSDRGYLGYIFAFALGFAGMMAYISASPFVIENVLGMSNRVYTIVFATNAAGMVVAGVVISRLVGRFGPGPILRIGQAVILVAGIVLLVLLVAGAPAALVLPVLFVMVAATPTVMGTASALAIGRARHAAGTASALMGALQFTLGAVVSPLVGLGGPATGVPMGIVIVVCACLGMIARRVAATAGEVARFEREAAHI
ncbi:multidrug effflux MFS transporter [Nocardia jinanensis]|uniref:Bcr/CflA family drug resistance efflux transporter n=1 Tax=Nocardia jinanensis TaxID=382504 RepID=A0A917RT95_9NOCA|nr:multidrug effflux MFS transporter [Nocardia jinanensis]GGL28714.1 Bcr/CflA family drug resistance efflux transporter [Nocardia jinanensis]